MRLYFAVLDTEQNHGGTLLRNFLRQCAVSTDLARAVKFRGGGFFADGEPILANRRVYPGQVVSFDLPPEGEGVAPQPDIPVKVVYEDAFAVVLEKPPHLAVHPTLNYPGGTLANGYAAWAAARGESPVFRPVNRIDKDTSGLVLAAKHAYAAPLLAQNVEKLYYAVAEGELPLGEGVIDAPIGRRGDSIIGRCVTPQPEIPVNVVYEDAFAVVLEKPPQLAVHPTLNYPGGTLANGYAAWAAEHGHSPVFRPVNRIDKDTSGLVLAAKNAYAAPLLAGGVAKLYYAIAQGALPLGEGAIDAPIGRRGDSIIGRCVTPEGKPSRTEYTIIKEENGLSLAACVPVTGRTHQIRVHFASIGHPLAGDDLYGGSREHIGRQALHCAKQSFAVPVYTPLPDGIRVEIPLQLRTVTVKSPLPPDMKALFS